MKFSIDIDHLLAWRVVQELGHVLNYVSVTDRLPTIFMPLSPPVYMNGGPREYLSWVIESAGPSHRPRSGDSRLQLAPQRATGRETHVDAASVERYSMVERRWAEEITRRAERAARGESVGRDANEVLSSIESKLRQR